MDLLEIREYCLTRGEEVEECTPFGPDDLAFKTHGRMFALLDLPTGRIALKCDPELAVELRERYQYVSPARHFNKKHWNGIDTPAATGEQLRRWIDHSYGLVCAKKQKRSI